VLARYRAQERLDDEGLSRHLGLSFDQLPWLALCRLPRPEWFSGDVIDIAERFAIDPALLASVIRQVDALSALKEAPDVDSGLLAAARDRDDEDEE
jgi:hypothetical protein